MACNNDVDGAVDLIFIAVVCEYFFRTLDGRRLMGDPGSLCQRWLAKQTALLELMAGCLQ